MYYRFILKNVKKAHQYEELIKAFLKPDEFDILLDEKDENCSNVIDAAEASEKACEDIHSFSLELKEDHNVLKKEIFEILTSETKKDLKWGIITGIRPVKLFGETVKSLGGDDSAFSQAEKLFREYYCVSDEKTQLTSDMYRLQINNFGEADIKSAGVYIGIPFCPSRCLYCSFTSNLASEEEIEKYLETLIKEVDFVADEMASCGMYAETIYIGGGTPTTLNEIQLKRLLEHINRKLKTHKLKEFTIEAGRPDTITEDKLKIIKQCQVERISINPQTMNDKTLKTIGRAHNSDEIRESFETAKNVGIDRINADLIVGLPGETLEDFKYSLNEVINMEPANITVHTLAVKRASKLAGIDKDYHYKQAQVAEEMLDFAYSRLKSCGYIPYYLYRQKHMAGAGENIGFCKKGTESLYNIRIMDEHQSIVAMGAGGISKAYYADENRLERVPNVSNYQIYMERIEDMMKRKEDNLFKEVR